MLTAYIALVSAEPADIVTSKVFLDVFISGAKNTHNRIVIGLFGITLPKTTENFRRLCMGNYELDEEHLVELTAKWDKMTDEEHRAEGVHTLDGMLEKMKLKVPSHGHYKWSEFHVLKKDKYI